MNATVNDSNGPSLQEPKLREVRYRHTSFSHVLRDLGCSLLVSTYQAGKLLAVGVSKEKLHLSFHNFDRAMGVAASLARLAVGTKGQIWFLDANHEIASTLKPPGQFDRGYLARRAHVTGAIQCHEMAWGLDGELWVVNTLFSCLATLRDDFSFVPRWRPRFISELAAEDRCHLNGLAMRNGRPMLVSVMAQTNTPAGWRPKKESTGCVLDIATGEPVTHGLAMPHSPRLYDNRLWILNSGCGTLETIDPRMGERDVVERLPGYTRGLAFCGAVAFVGLSRIRESAVFGGVPIAQKRDELKCGVGAVDLRSGRTIATLEFESGVEEIFDVQVLPHTRCPALHGPWSDQDGAEDIWIVPPPAQAARFAGCLKGHSPKPHGEDVDALVRRALELQRSQCVAEAIDLFQQAAAQEHHTMGDSPVRPRLAEIFNHLGNALQDTGQQEAALEVYAQAVAANPCFGPALQNLGYVLVAQGRTDEGIERLKQAQDAQPTDVNHILIATALPAIYESHADLCARRSRITSEVARQADEGLRIDTTNTLVPTNFFAAYQGENDRELQANLGRIYRGIDLCGAVLSSRGEGKKLRVGFLSAYFRDHTIGRLNIGRIEHLPRDRFEVIVLSVGAHRDELAERFQKSADKYVVIPRDVALASRMIADERLDILLFADVGMDALTYTLAFSRMAPVQCATWGHPTTTGSPAIDYFLSSDLLETLDAEAHYTERLLRPPSLCTYYYRPQLTQPSRTRSSFKLPSAGALYACPQTLFKFHPDFDAVLAELLRRDADGHLVLLEGRTANWTAQLKARFARTMPDVTGRICWLSAMPNEDYLQLLALSDVMLDPLHFGGGNTSYEALAVGTPVVTLPGSYLKSRIALALYRKMAGDSPLSQTPAPVTASTEEYVDLACRLAMNVPDRNRTRDWIRNGGAALFEDSQEVDDFATTLETIAAQSVV